MDNALTSRSVVVGHLTLTIPAIAAIILVPFFGLRMFGPFFFVYYLLAGAAVGWQWYSVALPSWKKWLAERGADREEIDNLAHRAGLAWPVDSAIGPFALHTTVAALCGIHFGPWLLSRWYVWIMPLAGMSPRTPTGSDYLQHFELASIVPAFVVGYLLSRHFGRLATYAWILPTIILAYKLLTFVEPQVSVFTPHSSTRFEYFFVTQRTMPTFTPGFGGVDPIRVVQQMFVVAPFYAGLAYTAGAITAAHDVLKRIFGSSSLQLKQQMTDTEKHPEDCAADESETPVHEQN
jgi:hypothetical protein